MTKKYIVLIFLMTLFNMMDSCSVLKESSGTERIKMQSSVDSGQYSSLSAKTKECKDTVSAASYNFVYVIEENGKWGWLNHQGEVVVPPKYDSIGRFNSECAIFRLGNHWGAVDKSGRIIADSLMSCQEAEKYTMTIPVIYIDYRNGKASYSPYPAQRSRDTVYYEDYGVIKHINDPLTGQAEYIIIDKNRNPIGDKTFTYISDFHEGIAVAGLGADTVLPGKTKYGKKNTMKRSRYGFINSKGEFIIEPIYNEIGPWPSDAPIRVRIGGIKIDGDEHLPETCTNCKYGYINNEGKIIIPVIYDRAKPFDEGVAWIKTDCNTGGCAEGKDGLIDTLGKYIWKPDYTFSLVGHFLGENAVVCIGGRTIDNEHVGGKWGIINKRGEWIVKPEYDQMKYPYGIADNLIRVNKGCRVENHYICKGGKWGILHISGKAVVPCVYDDIDVFDNGMASVRAGGQYGLIDTNGQVLIKTKYDDLIIQNDLIAVNRGGKWTLIDKAGNEILPWIYDRIIPSGRVAVIQQDSAYGVTNPQGKIIIKPEYEEITVFDSVIRVKKSGKYGLLTMDGSLLCKEDYDFIGDFKPFELTIFRKGKAWGYYNPKGKLVWRSKE